MQTRRSLIVMSLVAPLAFRSAQAAPPAANDPVAILNAIYTRVAAGKGDGGGAFVFENKAAKAKYLSKSLIALWAKADSHVTKGDIGSIDFDPVTNSQDPDVKSFAVATEKMDADRVTLAVTLTGRLGNPKVEADRVIRYEFIREANGWKIDDIKGASDGEPWSVRAMLQESLKT